MEIGICFRCEPAGRALTVESPAALGLHEQTPMKLESAPHRKPYAVR